MVAMGHACTVLLSRPCALADDLRELGATCVVVGHGSFLQAMPSSKVKRFAKYPVRYVGYRLGFTRSIAAAERAVDFSEVDVIHSNVNRNDLGAELAARHGIPHVWHLREFSDIDFRCWSYRKRYVEYMAAHADRFIAVSRAVKQHFVAKGISPSAIDVIGDGVDPARFAARPPRTDSPTAANPLRFAFVGGVSPSKGQELVIRALAVLPDDVRNCVRVTFCGGGGAGYMRRLHCCARRLRVEGQVEFAGPEKDVPRVLAQSDMGLMCSNNEAFGLVTAEYLMAGLPVIASKSGANVEFFERGAKGVLFRAGDCASLAHAIESAACDSVRLSHAAADYAAVAQVCYAAQENAKAVARVYRELCGVAQ